MGLLQKVVENLRISAPAKKRSSKWPKVRAEHLLKHPMCEACGSTTKLEVHHIEPFHLKPELELDPNNFMTLCESTSNGIICHLNIGHNGLYSSNNPNAVEDAAYMLSRLNNRPK